MSPPVAVLIGLPGTGKSAVGAHLARRLKVDFADSDDLVCAQTQRSVAEIFSADGEATFRRIEAEVIATALQDFAGVLALGGGAVTTAAVRAELGRSGVCVLLLTASPTELLRRVAHGPVRPLLVGDTAARLAELSTQRQPLYEDVATLIIATSGRTIAQVSADISTQLIAQHA